MEFTRIWSSLEEVRGVWRSVEEFGGLWRSLEDFGGVSSSFGGVCERLGEFVRGWRSLVEF